MDTSVEDHRVHVAVVLEERRKLLHPVAHITHIDHPGVVLDEVGYQRLDLTEAQRERHLTHDPTDPDPRRALVVAEDVAAVVGDVVDLVNGRTHQGVTAHVLAVVDLRNVEFKFDRVVDVVGDCGDQEVRAPLVGRCVGAGHGQTVTVRDTDVLPLPVG